MKPSSPPRVLAAICLLLPLLDLGCRREPSDPELERQLERARNVVIYRDDFGVPHVYGKRDADAVFGLLYAQSEDDFPRVERNYVWAIGRLAEVEGEKALYSDLRARLYMTEEEARGAYASAPEWLQELCIAFADGINYYLRTHPEVQPRLLTRFEPWMPMYFFEGSIGGDIEAIELEGIEDLYGPLGEDSGETEPAAEAAMADAHVQDGGRSPWGFLEQVAAHDEPAGSNGFAIAGSLTRSGHAMLLINPHTSFYFRGEVHVASEEGLDASSGVLDAYGAVTWGQFFVYQGFNRYNGWMHTSTSVDFLDEFVEEVFERDGRRFYRYGDEERAVETGEVTLRYRDGDMLRERTFPTLRTHHGPITHQLDGRWVATKINWDPVDALSQSYLRTKTTGHASFREMMDIRTNSSNNTVFADSEGNIAYYHGNFVPRRNPGIDFSQPVDGSDPATDWQGLHTVDETVTLVNPGNGWIQNANSTPFTAAAEESPRREDYPRYMAPDNENFRGIHAVRVLEKLEAERDLTLEKLIELAYDPALPAFEVLLPGLFEAWDRAPRPDARLAEPIAALRAWDTKVSLDSVAMSLAHFYGALLLDSEHGKGQPPLERFAYLARELPAATRLDFFSRAVERIATDFGRWDTPWREINRFQRLDGAIDTGFDDERPSLPVPMASGNWGALAAFGTSTEQPTKRIFGTRGNSFVAVVEFGPRVRAMSLLAGGQSGEPASPHFDDQAQRYVEGQFKEVAYYREDVERRARKRYRPGALEGIHSLAAERDRRVEGRRPARRQHDRHRGDRQQEQRTQHQRRDIDRLDAVEQPRERPPGEHRRWETQEQPDADEPQPLPGDHARHSAAAGAERHAHADLAAAQRDHVGEQAVEPDRCEQQRNRGEDREHGGEEALVPQRARHELLECHHVVERLRRVDRGDGRARGIGERVGIEGAAGVRGITSEHPGRAGHGGAAVG
jgi:acyl-homoserine-lactone acylase